MISWIKKYFSSSDKLQDAVPLPQHEYAEWPAPVIEQVRIQADVERWLHAVTTVYPSYKVEQVLPFVNSVCEYWPADAPEMDSAQIAYALATIEHECSFESTAEQRANPNRDARNRMIWQWQENYWHTGYYGRGPSQLTWRSNYVLFGRLLGIPLAANPDLALDIAVGTRIVLIGMHYGLFTKEKIRQFLHVESKLFDWRGARNVYNADKHLNGAKIGKAAERIYLTCKNYKK